MMKRLKLKLYRALGVESLAHMKARIRRDKMVMARDGVWTNIFYHGGKS